MATTCFNDRVAKIILREVKTGLDEYFVNKPPQFRKDSIMRVPVGWKKVIQHNRFTNK